MATPVPSTAHCHDLVAAALAARTDPATARFDEEIAAAQARGELHPGLAEWLRSWQRASVRELEQHVLTTVPPIIAAVVESAERARAAVARPGPASGPAVELTSPQSPVDEQPPAEVLADDFRMPAEPDETYGGSQPSNPGPDLWQAHHQRLLVAGVTPLHPPTSA